MAFLTPKIQFIDPKIAPNITEMGHDGLSLCHLRRYNGIRLISINDEHYIIF